MAAATQTIDLVILSLLAQTPRYAHEIQQEMDHRGLRNWVFLGYASLYDVLAALEGKQAIRGEMPYGDLRSARKRFSLTPAGRGLLHTGVIERLKMGQGTTGAFELGLLLAESLPTPMIYDALQQRRADLKRQIDGLQAALVMLPNPEVFDVEQRLYERNLALLECDLAWLNAFEAEWIVQQQQIANAQRITTDRLRDLLLPED